LAIGGSVNPTAALLRADIERLIPHQGAMCLLEGVEQWDRERIVCHGVGHRLTSHPLRSRGGLLSTCLIEYAAQAMALHGALCGALDAAAVANASETAPAPAAGMLASARNVQFTRLRLDDLPPATPDRLSIVATREAASELQLLYEFSASHAGTLLASGRVSVTLLRKP
jgi:predicted hotdog family 3-hydroxylacyl-ACP dehydratase